MLNEASAVGAIVQLLAIFKGEKRSAGQQTIDDYLEWLRRHEHADLVKLLEGNSALAVGLSELIAGGQAETRQALHRIESTVLSVASMIPSLSEGIASISYESLLSSQSICLLQAMEANQATIVMELGSLSGKDWQFDVGGTFTPQEPRFMEDDIQTLVEFGFLRMDHVGKEQRNYRITRAGSSVVTG